MSSRTKQVERYLIYDAGCSACSRLANTIQEAAAGKLTAISIHADQAKALLDQAFPQGWAHAPYIAISDRGRVRVWTGLGATIRLAWLMGPPRAWRVWLLARRAGISLPPREIGASTPAMPRRRFLQVGAAVGAAVGWLLMRPPFRALGY